MMARPDLAIEGFVAINGNKLGKAFYAKAKSIYAALGTARRRASSGLWPLPPPEPWAVCGAR